MIMKEDNNLWEDYSIQQRKKKTSNEIRAKSVTGNIFFIDYRSVIEERLLGWFGHVKRMRNNTHQQN